MVNPTMKSIVGTHIIVSVEVQVEQQVTPDQTDETHEENQHIKSEASNSSIPNEEAHSLRELPMRTNFGKPPNMYGFEDIVASAL